MIKLLIEKDVFHNKRNEFIKELEIENFNYSIIHDFNYENYLYKNRLRHDVLFCGSFQLAEKIVKDTNWKVFCNLEKLNCSFYYPIFGEHLLNQNYVMLPFGDLIRRKKWLFDNFGCELFIRPCSAQKLFTGKVTNQENYEVDISLFKFYDVNAQEMIVVSDRKKIKKEWRFVIFENKVITGSQYFTEFLEPIPINAIEYVNSILEFKQYEPDKLWTLDVCLTSESDFKIIEVGSFSCADLYNSDYKKIVETLKRL